MDDLDIRTAAFAHLVALGAEDGALSWSSIAGGFHARGEHLLFANKARGIFKPKTMDRLLSVKTVHPRAGRKVWYEDQSLPFAEAISGQETLSYAFQGTDPDSHDNRLLQQAQRERTPIVYFLGVAPTLYQALFPAFVEEWNPHHLRVELSISNGVASLAGLSPVVSAPPADAQERRYGLERTKRRLHQTRFRLAVLQAYGGRCAVSGFPEPRLLDAAHIVEDGHADLGQPVVPNGLLLSRLHHGAYDAGLLGIDADLRVHVSRRLMHDTDSPLLKTMQDLDGTRLHLPPRPQDHPDRERLDLRFARFRAHA